MDTHVIRGFDPDFPETASVGIQISDEFVSLKEMERTDNAYREVLLEITNGTLQIRVFAADSDTPVVIRLPETGGVEIDRDDYDTNTTSEV